MLTKYAIVTGIVFAVVALLQLARILYAWPVQIGNFSLPLWASWVAVAVAGSLCIWAFASSHK